MLRRVLGLLPRRPTGRVTSGSRDWAPIAVLALAGVVISADIASAHHVLGRPSYSLNEDSNTPPSLQAEVEIGAYFVTYMVFPAFPKPGEPGRVNLYATRLDDGAPFQGEVTFKVRDGSLQSWVAATHEETLGTQPVDDNVFRQGFLFEEAGDYIITAEFEAGGEPYAIDFPLRIGAPAAIGPIGLVVAALLIALVMISLIQRRRAMTGKVRAAHAGQRPEQHSEIGHGAAE